MEWLRPNLGSLAELGPQYGANASAVAPTGTRPRYVRITDITADGRLCADTVAEAAIEDTEPFLLASGDLVFARSGATVGKTYLYDESDGPCIFAGYLIRFRLRPEIVDPKFAFYFTQSDVYHNWIHSRKRVAAQPNVNGTEYASLPIPLPTPSEQQQLLDVLNQADALRRQRSDVDAKIELILHALFNKMFGDPASNPRGWNHGKIGDVVLDTQYGTSVRASENGAGLPLLRMNNIDRAGYLNLKKLKYVELSPEDQATYRLEEGDILFNRTNSRELVGKTGIWTGEMEAVPASYLIRVRVDRKQLIPAFFWAYMNTPYVKRLLFDKARSAIGMANINAQELRGLPVIIPPTSEQEIFVARLEAIRNLNGQCTAARDGIDLMFNTLLHRAFNGDLTAKWRERHISKLEAELHEQRQALDKANLVAKASRKKTRTK